jgi:hypothetical protein
MPFLTFLLTYLVTFLLTELLRPKPNIEDAKPSGIGDFQVPTATEGRVVPIIWGRVKIAGPNVTWYGDLVADPITDKVKTGLFSSETVTTGFHYSIGLMMSLVRGPVDLLINIRNDESFAWGEDAPSADANVIPTDAGAAYNIDEPGFFGGEESGGGGGLVGGGRIFIGSETQAISAYLSPFQVPTPAYRGTCYLTWEQGEIGLGPTIRPFEFELQRIPDGLDLATLQPGDEEINLGANPMNVIFEALTNDEWGLNVGAGNVNVIALRAIAATLKTEGNGFAWVWDRQLNVLEVIRMIEEQVDGVLFADPVSNNYDFKLIRFDYTPGTLPLLDETNVTNVSRFQRPAWAETSNHVTVEFTDRRKNYTQSFALAQDMANVEIVQAVNAAAIKLPGVKDPTLANTLVWRELRQLSFPGATGQLTADRSQWDLTPGDVRELTWDRLGLTRLPIRIVKVNRGEILNNKIKIDWTQDIFSINAGTFSDPIDTGWIPVPSVAQPSLRERLWEVPFQLSLDNERHLAVICSRDGGLHTSFDVMADRSGGTAFAFEGTEADFTPTGLLAGAVFRDLDGPPHYLQDIEIDGLNDVTVTQLNDAGSTTVDPNNPANIFIVDEELFFYESATDLGGGLIRLVNCHRGTFDTIPADHADDAVVWLIGFGLGLMQRLGPLPNTVTTPNVKILPTTIRDQLDIASAAALGPFAVGQRVLSPIPPGDPFINLDRFVDEDWIRQVGTLDFTWNTRNKTTQDFDTKQDDPDLNQPGDVGARIIIRRVDNSVAVLDFDNIFSDQFITTDFLPQSSPGIPDELDFTVEISNKTTAGNESQINTSVPFEVFGFGLDFGGDFGGDAAIGDAGIVLSQGAPPFTPEPIPGSGVDRVWTIDFLGSIETGESRRLLFDITDTLNTQTLGGVSIFLDAAGEPTLEDWAEATREFLDTMFLFPPEPMPFTVTREGTQVIVTTRFGDLNLRQQPALPIFTPLNVFPRTYVLQAAAPPATPVQQIIYVDWFGPSGISITEDVLSPTNDPAFAVSSPLRQNITSIGVTSLTFEAQQELSPEGGNEIFGVRATAPRTDSRTQDLQEFYDKFRNSSIAQFFTSIEGPLVLRGGLDRPMARGAIVLTTKPNFRARTLLFGTSWEYTAGGPAADFNGPVESGFKLLPKEGSPAIAGSTTGLVQVLNVGVFNINQATPDDGTLFLSYTLDGTVFSEAILPNPAPPSAVNYAIAFSALMDAIDADPRFEVVNRLEDISSTSFAAQIVAVTPNSPFEHFADVGKGLRIEFRDLSP